MPKITTKAMTAMSIEKLKPDQSRYDVYDARVRGLGLRVATSGTKTWFAMRRVNGQMVRASIGRHPAVSLSTARRRGAEMIAKMDVGEDPRVVRGGTVTTVFEEWLVKDQAKNRRVRTVELAMRRHVLPAFKHRTLESVQRSDINDLLDRIVEKGAPVQANRVFAYLRRFFNWCVERDLLPHSPCMGVKPRISEVSRDRFLSPTELRAVWRATSEISYPFGPMAQLLILTGQRLVEVSNARWSEFDLDGCVWNLPATRTKNGRAHAVHLSPPVLEALKALPIFEGSPWLFTTTGGTPVSGFSKSKKKLDAVSGVTQWRFHDLRRSLATHLTESLDVSPVVADKILNHVSGAIKGVALVYQRGEYLQDRRNALDGWAEFVIGSIN